MQLLFTKKRHFQSVDLFSVYLLSYVDIVIHYIEVDFRLGFRIMFVILKNSLYQGSLH